ncbi:hypothetical protein BOO91_14665 [Vibrio navarrensis]|uniref:Terminase n=1 Tax=Vibrio navarrensis TaxID=29495 RepID=A0AAJ4I9G1_9VIBR|nr:MULTISPECIES: hypothetical protein [Vibrio]KJR21525.1 hypothetical protein UF06_19285 [Vibrio sp. S234-5]MBE3662173.1 hypothetical protein [Vibrio navarrensis]QPL52414.1 terminase [Vibrio navarrensis]
MSNKWELLQKKFEVAHARTGISAKEWCESEGLNYQTARRYIKVRNTAHDESAHRTAQNAQKHSAQSRSAQCAQKADKKKVTRKNGHKQNHKQSEALEPSNEHDMGQSERDESGRFLPGHKISVGNAGNPNPSNSAEPGNSRARKHGIYARYFKENELEKFDAAAIADLQDELELCRVRLQSGAEALSQCMDDIKNANSIEDRVSLYESYYRIENGLGSLTSRIESITRTLSALKIDTVKVPHIVADTKRVENAARKLGLEADKISKEGKGDDTPVSKILDDIRAMGGDGLMSKTQ